jgi:hypothetical protein
VVSKKRKHNMQIFKENYKIIETDFATLYLTQTVQSLMYNVTCNNIAEDDVTTITNDISSDFTY